MKTVNEVGDEGLKEAFEVAKNEFLLADTLDEFEDTEDESDDNELANFMMLMDKAQKKNEKRKLRKNNQFGGSKNDWRNVNLQDEDDDDTSDTDDEDDHEETTKFMSLMSKANDKNSVVKISLVNGKTQISKIKNGHEGELMYKAMTEKMSQRLKRPSSSQPNLDSSLLDSSSTAGSSKTHASEKNQQMVTISRFAGYQNDKDLLQRRKEEYRSKVFHEGFVSDTPKGKRKFTDRMTLAEASSEDFEDSQDYVNFLQDKLQGIKIKLMK